MENSITKNHRNIAAGIHLLTFGKWFFPLGNFILPLILWLVNADKSAFIDKNGREALNFQISMALYTVILAFIGGGIIIGSIISGGPLLWEAMDGHDFPFSNDMGTFSLIVGSGVICGSLILILAIVDLVCTIMAVSKALDGTIYKYPLTIKFLGEKAMTNNTTNL